MNPQRRRWLQTAAVAPWLASCAVLPGSEPPPLPREFRGAWVATVANIDWPSRPGLPSAQQRQEMHALLAQAKAIGLNAIVLQVRPSADAIYPSALEPWSEYLGGASGRPPDAPWDPLAEWIAHAHGLGLELHAWFNPYRARHPSARSAAAASHVVNAEPQLVRAYGDQLWMDPAEPRAAQRLLDVVRDVLQRYDVDGVHIDDYFYPYPVVDAQGAELPFPDDVPWQRHLDAGGAPGRAAWRRAQVDALVERLHRDVHAAKPWVRVGVSPFGLPRPDRRPPGIAGFSQYDKLHADVERWLAEGWLDYLAPQLYWPIAQAPQAFAVLQQTWREGNPQRRHIWPGLFTSRLGAERNAYDAAEVLAQVALTRHAGAVDDGHLHFSMAALLQDRDGIAGRLRQGPYAQAALTPATPWLDEPPPQPPAHAWQPRTRELMLKPGAGAPLRQVVLWTLQAEGWRWQALPMPQGKALRMAANARTAWLIGIGRSGLESRAVQVF
ncbi:MAG: hypothetical protein ABS84_01040 [Rubrivivax sp. SCN 71-131]|jgi:uncharacterized lipoprotein YddW (UPF0748 family)|nr:MAG: hypothetical protein ABS84_01040 [Rubrivivax sp. SCN 71-131]